MLIRRPLLGLTMAVLFFPAPVVRADVTIRTQNFVVEAPTREVAQQFGQMAEQYRKQKALEWLGHEMPPWPQPCPLNVKPTMGGAGGATTFNYDYRGGYQVQSMNINGNMERMLHSVLPHEITHTVFADFFRYPVPRWADEGGSVLSEDDRERANHDKMIRDMLNGKQALQLRRLFQTKEYGELNNVIVLYAQGYSVSDYLVGLGGRQNFLGFVQTGMRGDWDKAVQTYYRFPTVEALEKAWLDHLIDVKKQRMLLAQNSQNQPGATDVAARSFVRNTAPPAQPQLDPAGPVVRGQASDWYDEPRPGGASLTSRPTHLPDANPAATMPPVRTPIPPAPAYRPNLPPVRLGLPEFGPVPQPNP